MNKTILAFVIAVIALGSGVAAVVVSNNNSDTTQNNTMNDDANKMVDGADKAMIDPATEDESMMMDEEYYITLAEFDQNKSKYANSTKILYFHASWCPDCKAIEDSILSDSRKVPEGVVLIKTDFDDETALRQKHGVTYQHTFVQIDTDGNQIDKWNARNLDDAIAGIKN